MLSSKLYLSMTWFDIRAFFLLSFLLCYLSILNSVANKFLWRFMVRISGQYIFIVFNNPMREGTQKCFIAMKYCQIEVNDRLYRGKKFFFHKNSWWNNIYYRFYQIDLLEWRSNKIIWSVIVDYLKDEFRVYFSYIEWTSQDIQSGFILTVHKIRIVQ